MNRRGFSTALAAGLMGTCALFGALPAAAEPAKVALTIDGSKRSDAVTPYAYGMFIEPIGGLVGALVRVGVPEHDAQFYAEAVRRGGILVILKSDDDVASVAADILSACNAVDVDKRRKHFETTGFSGYSPEAKTYTLDELARERQMYRDQVGERIGGPRVFPAA